MQFVLDLSTNRYETGCQHFALKKKKKKVGSVFGFLFIFGSRPDSNVCIRKAALKSSRTGLGVLLRCGMEGRERIAAIRKVDVSFSFPISCVTECVTIS